ncbi:MAG TPA: hypothetical protein VND43_07455 [Burkholderiales bacterium]|nr:hypothetical protein [Burkholderiales bacterium]
MLTTTLNRIKEYSPCHEGWKELLGFLNKNKADNDPLGFDVILESNGLTDAVWCLQAEPNNIKEYRLFGIACARDVQHLMVDERSIKAIDAVEMYAMGEINADELQQAYIAACLVFDKTMSYEVEHASSVARRVCGAGLYGSRIANNAYRFLTLGFEEVQKERFIKMIESL